MVRIRIHYSRGQELRYVGSLDIHKIWERYLRRAHLPVAYSQGFHPQPKIQQACPLPLGFLSEAEMIDIWLDGDNIDLLEIAKKLTETSQPGINIRQIHQVALQEPAMMTRITEAEYRTIFLDDMEVDQIAEKIKNLLACESLPRERRGKSYNLRPLISELQLEKGQQVEIRMRLAAREGATGRPEEVVAELGLDPYSARYIRTRLITA